MSSAKRKREVEYDFPWMDPAATRAHAASRASASRQPPQQPVSAPAPAPKRARKKADPSVPAPEKRGAIFKKKCPQNILDRVERVASQTFYMVDRRRNGNELREEFSVLGSTGNVYTVIIDKKPSCNCPDATKGNHCKHILFIFLKVLQVTQASGFWYQKALLTSELETIFAEAPAAPNAVTDPRVRDAYARATGKATPAKSNASNPKKRLPGPDDDCPICYEGLQAAGGKSEESLTFCESCGNSLHTECFNQWKSTSARSGKALTCVWCRANWVLPAAASGSGTGVARRTSEGYINLADVAGVSPVRDTSSCECKCMSSLLPSFMAFTDYHGPRRGQRHYGYQDYDDFY
ncbi:hypothetical protein HGRIS_007893 [Hohenbuehelia grisea]|uniref:Mitogen-activated protein kinase kinase kinase 1 n=1 Tax=Hohenbuehelia grisea TaxID=104357 RepID=A0ABR3J706_9AGAR